MTNSINQNNYTIKLCSIITAIVTSLLLQFTVSIGFATVTLPNTLKCPWTIMADHFSYDYNKNLYKLSGSVTAQKGQIKISTNALSLNYTDMVIEANQGASITMGKDSLTCRTLKLNLKQETGIILEGSIFLQENNLHITGNKIEKTGKNTYKIDAGTVTTCTGNDQAWSISGNNILIEKGNHGTLKNAILKIKKIPIFYLPFLMFPTERRQSGLLSPVFNYTNNTINYCQPFFIKINKNSDVTFYPSYKFNTDLSSGLEYRYLLDDTSKGLLMIDWVKDKSTTKSNRYWLRSKADQKLPMNFIAKLEVNLVSDSTYLEECKTGYLDFNKTNKYFKDFIGKNCIHSKNNLKNNHLLIGRIWSNFAFNTAVYWNKDSIRNNISDTNTKPQKISITQFNSNRKRLINSPFWLEMNLKHKYSNLKSTTNKQRTQLTMFEPKLYVPFTIGNIFFVDMSIGSQETIIRHNTSKSNRRISDYNFKLDIFTEFSRIYKKNLKNIESLKHSIKIKALYEYGPETSCYVFDCLDERHCTNYVKAITYSISNSIITKAENRISNSKNKKYNYKRLFFFDLQQSFKDQTAKRTFSDIIGELYVNFNDDFNMHTRISVDPYSKEISSHNSKIYTKNTKNYHIMLGYLYERNKKEVLKTSIGLPLGKHMTATLTCKYDCLENRKSVETLSLYYNAQCWSTNISYRNNNGKNPASISFSIGFSGIGNNDTQLSQMAQEIHEDTYPYENQWKGEK